MGPTLDIARAEVAAAGDASASAPGFAEKFDGLFARMGQAALQRDGGPEHVTASCLVIDPRAESVLLNHHRKSGMWGQFGGHLEPHDESLREAARRETLEESGLDTIEWLSSAPIDLHVHSLSASFGKCSTHFDVVYGAAASIAETIAVSDESLSVKWFRLSELPSPLMPDLIVRLPQLYAAALREFTTQR